MPDTFDSKLPPNIKLTIECNCGVGFAPFYEHAKDCPFYYLVAGHSSMSLDDQIKASDYAWEMQEKYGPGWSMRHTDGTAEV